MPAGTPVDPYTIQAVYSGTADFKPVTATSTLTVGAATTTTAAVNKSTSYSESSQTVTLNATVTSTAGTVNEATVTFSVLSGSTVINGSVSVPISATGTASTQYTLPAGLAGGKYTIEAVYDGGPNFMTSTDKAHTLMVNPATGTTTAAANQTATFSTSAYTVMLNATVSNPAGTVGEGSETFTVLSGTNVIGTATTGYPAGGAVSVNYTIPANTPVGTYTIKAVYNGTLEFSSAIDNTHKLTINAAAPDVSIGAITVNSSASTGDGTAPAKEGSQATSVLKTSVDASTSSSGHKVHRSSLDINRGPLSIGRHATGKHSRSSQKLLVADRRAHTDARPGHA